jgi:putative ABC transport system permease protein
MDDVRFALRSLRKQPGFVAVAVLTLAIGIGVNVSVFGMLSAFYLRPLSVPEPERLVVLMQRTDVINLPIGYSYPDYLDFRAGASAFADLAAFAPQPAHISSHGQPAERTWIDIVSPNYFTLAGVTPAVGAFPSTADGFGKTTPTVVLSYRYWQRRFGGDATIVGRTIAINGRPFTVSGVTQEGFTGLSWGIAVSAYVPAGGLGSLMNGGDAVRTSRGAPLFRLMGRLAPGRRLADARHEIEVVSKRLSADFPVEHKNSRPLVIPETHARPDPSISGFMPIFATVFSGMVGLILLIACTNVANLMLSRALFRQRDLVIRSALGAPRARLIRLQLVEAMLLAIVAGVLGTLIAQWAGRGVAALFPAGDMPINPHQEFDWRIPVFTLGISLLAGIVTGLWPARRATRFDLVRSLKEGAGAIGASRHRLRNLLVVGEMTMSCVVLVSAGLFVHSLRQAQAVPLGFNPDGLVMMSLDLGLQQYDDRRGAQFVDELLRRAEALPGVRSATATLQVPFDYTTAFATVAIDGDIPGTKDKSISMPYTVVGRHYFETAGSRIMEGRAFDDRDNDRSGGVAIVNETMARTLWPKQDPIGRRFRLGSSGNWVQVVGVAEDGKYIMLAETQRAYFYMPLSQQYRTPVTILARAAGDPAALAVPLQKLVAQLDPDLPIFNLKTVDTHIRTSVFGLMPLRAGAVMAAVQGATGLLLAVMGLYAVVAYAVARRTREIGVRMALGAAPADVLRLVVGDGLRLSLFGIGAGTLLAVGVGLVLSVALYGLRPIDVPVLATVVLTLLAVSALACYLPARRAIRVDPLLALRSE